MVRYSVVPLLSMQQSVLLCISTILDSGNHYTKMMELVDDYGNTVFETIKITLVCDDCMKTDHPVCTTILCQNVYLTLCLWIVVLRRNVAISSRACRAGSRRPKSSARAPNPSPRLEQTAGQDLQRHRSGAGFAPLLVRLFPFALPLQV